MTLEDWASPDTWTVTMLLNGDALRPLDLDPSPIDAASFLVVTNGGTAAATVVVPAGSGDGAWSVVVDTTERRPVGRAFREPKPGENPQFGSQKTHSPGEVISLEPFAMMVLRRPGRGSEETST